LFATEPRDVSSQLQHIRQSAMGLPDLARQTILGNLNLAEENRRSKVQIAALDNQGQRPRNEVEEVCRNEVEELQRRIAELKCDLGGIKRTARKEMKAKLREQAMRKHTPHSLRYNTVDADRVADYAYALLEGAEARDIACLMLNEIDSEDECDVLGGYEECTEEEEISDTADIAIGAKIHELEGVIEVTLNRVAWLEEQLREIRQMSGIEMSP
jgi:hypothetical protein